MARALKYRLYLTPELVVRGMLTHLVLKPLIEIAKSGDDTAPTRCTFPIHECRTVLPASQCQCGMYQLEVMQ